MLAFLTELVSDNILTIASLGILLVMYVCKRIFGKSYKRRINNMIPTELSGHTDVQSEVSDVVKELEDLSFTLAKYGYRLTFNVDIVKIIDVDDGTHASIFDGSNKISASQNEDDLKGVGYINE